MLCRHFYHKNYGAEQDIKCMYPVNVNINFYWSGKRMDLDSCMPSYIYLPGQASTATNSQYPAVVDCCQTPLILEFTIEHGSLTIHRSPWSAHIRETLGYGRCGVVIHRKNQAIKIPSRHPWSSEADVDMNIEVINHEQDVYRRFNSFPSDQIDGVVPCIELSTNATKLAYMENGDLRTYLTNHSKPSRAIQLAWSQQMARSLDQIHDKCVLVADIATRNFLLDSELSIKVCDFSEASILALGTAMETVDDGGFSIQTDIGQLGAVIYEVVTGERCGFDLFKYNAPDDGRAAWPR